MQKTHVAGAIGLLGLVLIGVLFWARKSGEPERPIAAPQVPPAAPSRTPIARPAPQTASPATPPERNALPGSPIRVRRPGRPDQMVQESDDLMEEREERLAQVRRRFDGARSKLRSEFAAVLNAKGLQAAARFLEGELKPATDLEGQARVLESLDLYANMSRKVVAGDRETRPLAAEQGVLLSTLRGFIADVRNPTGLRSVAIGFLAGFDPDVEIQDSPVIGIDGVPTYDFSTPLLPRWGVHAEVRSAPDPANLFSTDPVAAKLLMDVVQDGSQVESIRRVALLSLSDNLAALKAIGLDSLARTSPALVPEIVSLWGSHPEVLSVDQGYGLLSLPLDDRTKAAVLSKVAAAAPADPRLAPLLTQVLLSPVGDDLGSRTLFRSALDQIVTSYTATRNPAVLTCLAQALPQAAQIDWRGNSPVGRVATLAADRGWVEWGPILRPLLTQVRDASERAMVEQALDRLKR